METTGLCALLDMTDVSCSLSRCGSSKLEYAASSLAVFTRQQATLGVQEVVVEERVQTLFRCWSSVFAWNKKGGATNVTVPCMFTLVEASGPPLLFYTKLRLYCSSIYVYTYVRSRESTSTT